MKIRDLLIIEKVIEAKRQELEKLRQEANEFKLMLEINSYKSQDDMININNVYLFKEVNDNYISFIKKQEAQTGKYKLTDVFTGEVHRYFDTIEFIDAECHFHKLYRLKYIKDAFPEVLAYPDGNIPKLLLQQLYYQANNIDEKVLKKALMKDQM